MECLPSSDTQIWITRKTPEKVIQDVLLNSIYLWVMLEWFTVGQKLSQSAPTLGTHRWITMWCTEGIFLPFLNWWNLIKSSRKWTIHYMYCSYRCVVAKLFNFEEKYKWSTMNYKPRISPAVPCRLLDNVFAYPCRGHCAWAESYASAPQLKPHIYAIWFYAYFTFHPYYHRYTKYTSIDPIHIWSF